MKRNFKVPDFLIEIFSEEIPARMQPDAARQLQERFSALLSDVGMEAARIEAHVTPRRLALMAFGLPAESAPIREERRGPRTDAPEKAIDGFLKSTGLPREALEERDDPKGRFLYAVFDRPGVSLGALLAERLPALIEGFSWPKSQRWGDASLSTASPRWVRPLRRIVALIDADVVPFEALGIASGRETFGHRFLSRGPVSVRAVGDYAQQLRDAYVILSADERRDRIRAGAEAAAAAAGLLLVEDKGLEAENAGLTEWPVPLLGRFDPDYLSVPREIIQLTMRTNQKYFALNDADGGLAPAFLCVANLVAPDGGETIVRGNERVLSARLSDARFFWEQDLKTPLENLLPKLEDRLFFEGLGTLLGKAERMSALAGGLSRRLFSERDPAVAERAARLAKADLASATVNEFPEVQGRIGGYMAAAWGEAPEISAAISEQYTGQVSGPVSAAVSLADRLDTLVAFFSRDMRPTGSRDPFALRRAALQAIQIICDGGLRLPLLPVLAAAEASLPPGGAKDVGPDVLEFLIDRLKVQQRDAGVRHDLIDAVVALGGEDDIVRLLSRVEALQHFIHTDDGANLLAGYRRAANILRIEEKRDGVRHDGPVDPNLLEVDAEKALYAALDAADGGVVAFLEREDFSRAMETLAALRQKVDDFFAMVIVNAENPSVRANRLAILARLRSTANQVADFSRIGG